MFVDSVSVVNVGATRTTPPGPGAEPQRDAMLRAHLGWLALLDGSEQTVDDIFCAVLEDDGDFAVATQADDTFCVVLEDDGDFAIATQADDTFCVVLEDYDEVQL